MGPARRLSLRGLQHRGRPRLKPDTTSARNTAGSLPTSAVRVALCQPGIYSVLSNIVCGRSREIGIRTVRLAGRRAHDARPGRERLWSEDVGGAIADEGACRRRTSEIEEEAGVGPFLQERHARDHDRDGAEQLPRATQKATDRAVVRMTPSPQAIVGCADCTRPYATDAASTPTTAGTRAGARLPPMTVTTVAPAMITTSPAAANGVSSR